MLPVSCLPLETVFRVFRWRSHRPFPWSLPARCLWGGVRFGRWVSCSCLCYWKYPRTAQKSPRRRFGLKAGRKTGMAFSSLPSLPVSLYGAVWDHRPCRASPWKPSFGFSMGFPPFFPVVASCSSLLGRVWEGATAPIPIKNWVSEANSFSPPLPVEFSSYPQALACVLNVQCVLCVPRARSLYAPPRKVRNSGLKVRNSGLKVRNSGLKVS